MDKLTYDDLLKEHNELSAFLEREASKVLVAEAVEGTWRGALSSEQIIKNLCARIVALEAKNKDVIENCVCKRENYK